MRLFEATHGAYTSKEIFGEISYADGIRLLNQFYLDADPSNILVSRRSSVDVDLRKLFG